MYTDDTNDHQDDQDHEMTLDDHRNAVLRDLASRLVAAEAAVSRLVDIEAELDTVKQHATKAKRPVRQDGGATDEELADFAAELSDVIDRLPDEVARLAQEKAAKHGGKPTAGDVRDAVEEAVDDFVYPHDRSKTLPFGVRYLGHTDHNKYEAHLRSRHEAKKNRTSDPKVTRAMQVYFGVDANGNRKGGKR